tara:strand:+ start:79 stop:930 length:852 start_codon:yes stop_codon:yes gene_type:complete
MPFDYKQYNTSDAGLSSPHSDAYANKGFVVSFYHMISGKSVRFKAFITTLNETYSPDYASETVFGRADPIHTYKNTTRNISLAFKVPAASTGEAYENLAKAQTLIQMLYPAYTDVNNALTVSQAPLMRLKVMNLIRKSQDYGTNTNQITTNTPQNLYDSYSSEDNVELGLLGVIQNVTVQHNIESEDVGVLEKSNNTVLPKLIEINLDFKPLHEHSIGWTEGNSFSHPAFPYDALEYGNPGSPMDTAPSQETLDDTNQAELDQEEANQESITSSGPLGVSILL